MSIGALFEAEGFSQKDYDAVVAQLGDEPPEGCLLHIAGPMQSGWRVIEVWDSEESQRRFQSGRLDPAFDAAGTSRHTPSYFDVHTVLPPQEALASLAPGA